MNTVLQKFKELNLTKLFPFISDSRHYSYLKLKADIMAALTVGIIAVPQSMAYAIIAGVNPRYGLYAAIFPVIVAGLFSASRYVVAGPTNAISMVVSSSMLSAVVAGTVVGNFSESEKISFLFLLSFMVGVIQLLMGILKFGNLINFVSHSVIVGFTAGAGILIGFNQLKNLFGVNIGDHPHFIDSIIHTFIHIPQINIFAFGLGLFTICFIVFSKKISSKIPGALLAMIISAIVVVIFNFESKGVKLIGAIPQSLPPFSFFPLTIDSITGMFTSAMAIAILGIVEALSIAKSIASKSGEKIDGNQEFIAQGLANMTAGFTSSIPGSGSFTRSAVNFSSGAKTRFSVVFSGVFVLLVVVSFAPFAKFIPISSLAGILMVIAYSMVDQHAFKMTFKATKTDRTVLLTTMIATLFLHLDQAVYLGVILSIILFVRKVSHSQVSQVVPGSNERKLVAKKNEEKTCPQISIFQIEGSIFFGAAGEIEEKISAYIKNGGRICIIRMAHVRIIDATGVHAFESLIKEARVRNITMLFANVSPSIIGVLERTGLMEEIGREHFFEHTSEALSFAVKKIEKMGKCEKCPIRVFNECKK